MCIVSQYQSVRLFYFRFHCKVDMKCMVSYIHWYHEMNNGKWNRIAQRILKRLLNFSWIGNDFAGSVRLLRTGASAGTPYSYYINKVNTAALITCQIKNPSSFLTSRNDLDLFQVSPADSGFYSCVAGNILGESVSTAHLAISAAPLSIMPHPLTMVMALTSLLRTLWWEWRVTWPLIRVREVTRVMHWGYRHRAGKLRARGKTDGFINNPRIRATNWW